MASQWQNFLRNLGDWRGSFVSLGLDGTELDRTDSLLTLAAEDEDRLVRFRLQRFAPGSDATEPLRDVSEEYRSLGRQVVFFDTGSFCKGTLQVSPGTPFGGEFGFVERDRRHRLVQLHNAEGALEQLVLIREFRVGSAAVEQPPLQADALTGVWSGPADTISADWPEPDRREARLLVNGDAAGALQLQLQLGTEAIPCQGRLQWLPDGGYHLSPARVDHRSAFAVQAGWMPAPGELRCLIRCFDASGAWQASHALQLQRG